MKVTFDPTKITPPALGGYTLTIWKGPTAKFGGAGDYEVPDGIAKHPDWAGLVTAGASVEIKPKIAPKSAKSKSSPAGAKNPPEAS